MEYVLFSFNKKLLCLTVMLVIISYTYNNNNNKVNWMWPFLVESLTLFNIITKAEACLKSSGGKISKMLGRSKNKNNEATY